MKTKQDLLIPEPHGEMPSYCTEYGVRRTEPHGHELRTTPSGEVGPDVSP